MLKAYFPSLFVFYWICFNTFQLGMLEAGNKLDSPTTTSKRIMYQNVIFKLYNLWKL